MGFLDILKGGAADASVALDLSAGEVLPGSKLELKAVVDGELDDKVENLQLGVRCINKYTRIDRDRDGSHRVTTTDTVYEDIVPVSDGAPSVGTHTRTVDVPADALPSAEDAIEWEAVARIARHHGRDIGEEQPLTVLLTPERYAAVEQKPPVVHGAPVSVRFEELTRRVRVGDKVTGVLVVTAQEDMKAKETRLNLAWRKTDSAEVYNWDGTDIAQIGGVRVSLEHGGGLAFYGGGSTLKESAFVDALRFDEIELPAGQDVRFPFTLALPAGSVPTLAAPHTAIQWRVEGVLERRMKDDIELGIELNVFNAPPA